MFFLSNFLINFSQSPIPKTDLSSVPLKSTAWTNASVISDDATDWNTGNSRYPEIAIDGNGVVHVVWSDYTTGIWGTDAEIFYASYNRSGIWSNGTAISGLGLNSWNNQPSITPDIAVSETGTLHVVWADYTDGEWGSDIEIMYANYTNTEGWSNATAFSGVGVNSWNDGTSRYPAVAVDPSGDVHVVWEDNTVGEWGADYEVMYSKYEIGSGWTNATILSDNASDWNLGASYRPDIAVDKSGVVHVVWYDYSDGPWGSDIEILYKKYTPGFGWSEVLGISGEGVNSWNIGTSRYPAITVDDEKIVHVVWEDYTNGEWGSDGEIMYMNYTEFVGWTNATAISGVGVNSWNNQNSIYPSIFVDNTQTVHVAWQDDTDGEWGIDFEIMYTCYNHLGWSNASVISDDHTKWNNDSSWWPQIAVDAVGEVHVVWEDYTNGPWGGDYEIMHTNLIPSTPPPGAYIWQNEMVWDNVDLGLSTFSSVLDSQNNPHIAYYDDVNMDLIYITWNGTAWINQTVEDWSDVGRYPSIALDSNGYPHISYYIDGPNDALKYAKWNGTAWETEYVENPADEVGWYSSLVLDDNNHPHISYIDVTNTRLKYAHWNGSVWLIQLAASSPSVATQTDIALDSNGDPHICYSNYVSPTERHFYYAYWNDTFWITERIHGIPIRKSGQFCSIDIDSNDQAHFAFKFSGSYEHIKYAFWNGSAWQAETVAPVGNFPSLVLDSNDIPHIAYGGYGPEYAVKVGDTWHTENAIESNSASFPNLALDTNEKPRICWYNSSDQKIFTSKTLGVSRVALTSPKHKHVWNPSENQTITWTAVNVTSIDIELYYKGLVEGDFYNFTIIANGINASDGRFTWQIPEDFFVWKHYGSSFFTINISSTEDGDVYDCSNFFRISPQRGWFKERVDRGGSALSNVYTDIALDSYGNPHLVFSDSEDDQLRYLHWDGEWQLEILESGIGDIGEHCAIKIDSRNYPHIVYYDPLNWELKYARMNDSGWFIETVDSGSFLGQYCSVDLDSSDNPHISYYSGSGVNLKYARYNGKQWFIEDVQTAGDVGFDTSIALDPSDYPHISYLDASISALRCAHWNGTHWNFDIVDNTATVGQYTSIAVDNESKIHISYYDYNTNNLKYAYWNGSEWIIEYIDFIGDVGKFSSLALDSKNLPHIVYQDQTYADIVYTFSNGTGWFFQNLDVYNETSFDIHCSIVLDSQDRPHISYYGARIFLGYMFLVNETILASPPQSLQANFSDGNILLNWSEPHDDGGMFVEKYDIYRGTSSGTETYYTSVSATTTTYLDLRVENKENYYYYVRAVTWMGESNASNEVSITPDATVLVVDDDAGQTYETYFKQALLDNGTSYRVWDLDQFGNPNFANLSQYEVVVWTTGAESGNTLTSTDQNNLMQYLDISGRLYLSSQDLLFDLGTSNTFVNNYLHVTGVTNDVSYPSVQGVGSDPITDVFGTLVLNYTYTNDADEITIDGSATQIFTNPSTSNIIGNRVDNGTFKLVFTAFAFEGIQNQDALKGEDFLNRTLTWLLAPPNDTKSPTVNNPSAINYAANSTNDFTNWILSDNVAGGYYRVLRNSSTHVDWTPWTRWMNLTVPVDTNNGIVVWKYTIQYNDSLGNWGLPDTVLITIFDNTAPLSNSPIDTSYPANSTLNTIDWILTDNAGSGDYQVLKNDTVYSPWQNWTIGVNLGVPVDTNNGLGAWNYTIQFNDSVGIGGLPDTVIITIYDNTTPTSNTPPSVSHNYNTSATIGWILNDNTGPGLYQVLLNESEYQPWQPWSRGVNLAVPINTTKNLGVWNYTIQYNDSEGLEGTPHTVIITIIDNQPPTSNSPPPASYGANSTGNTIDWILTDNYAGGNMRVLLNDSDYSLWKSWTSGANLGLLVDTNIGLGDWNYTVQFNDSIGNWGVSHTVIITIIDDIAPQSSSPLNASYGYGIPANITWTLIDNLAAGYYRVLREGIQYQGWQQWTNNSALDVSIDSISLGIWNYTIQYNDSFGLWGISDTVFITIFDDQNPTVNTPEDANYRVHSVINYQNWILTDNIAGGNYRVFRNESPHTSWIPWTSGANLTVPINTSVIGVWNYTIIYNDSWGLSGTPDMVLITIYDDVIPTSDSPTNASYLFGSSPQIQWTLTDNYAGGLYQVLLDGNPYVAPQAWSSGVPVNVTIDTSSLGTYNYTIQYYDSVGLWGISDTVFITIYEIEAPTSSQPNDAVYPVGTSGLTIDWILTDNVEGGFYRVFRNGIPYQSWQPWTNGTNLQIPVETNEAGVWSYTVQFNDSYGLFGIPDTVGITIYDDQPPTINSPSDAPYLLGSTGNTIDWIITDNSIGGNYRVLRNDTEFISWNPWINNSNLQVQIDTSSLGVWNYTIQFYDSGGLWGVPNTILITIYDNVPPTSSDPPDSTQGQNTSGGFISWVLYDTGGGGYYRVLVNSTEYIPWTPWLHGVSLIIPVDSFRSIGTWNYTIQYNDSAGVWGNPNAVFVQISEAGGVQQPSDPSGTDTMLIIAILIAGIAIAAAIILHAFIRRTPTPTPPPKSQPKPKPVTTSKPKPIPKSKNKKTLLNQRLAELEKSFEEGKISQGAYESLKKDLMKRLEEG